MRNGKIARLPRKIRHQLNHRLADGQSAETLLPWLNDLPAAKTLLATDFAGQPITKQNLSQWRTGGFAQWEARQDLLADAQDLAEDSGELTAATRAQLPEHLATVLQARYASLLLNWDGEENPVFTRKLRALRPLCHDITRMQRAQQCTARVKLEQDRLAAKQKLTETELVDKFEEWLKKPGMRDAICSTWKSPLQRRRRLLEMIFPYFMYPGGFPAHILAREPELMNPEAFESAADYQTAVEAKTAADEAAALAAKRKLAPPDAGRVDLPVNQGDLATTSLPVTATPNENSAPHPPLAAEGGPALHSVSEGGPALRSFSEGGSQSVKASQSDNSEPTVQTPVAEPVKTPPEKPHVPLPGEPGYNPAPFVAPGETRTPACYVYGGPGRLTPIFGVPEKRSSRRNPPPPERTVDG